MINEYSFQTVEELTRFTRKLVYFVKEQKIHPDQFCFESNMDELKVTTTINKQFLVDHPEFYDNHDENPDALDAIDESDYQASVIHDFIQMFYDGTPVHYAI